MAGMDEIVVVEKKQPVARRNGDAAVARRADAARDLVMNHPGPWGISAPASASVSSLEASSTTMISLSVQVWSFTQRRVCCSSADLFRVVTTTLIFSPMTSPT